MALRRKSGLGEKKRIVRRELIDANLVMLGKGRGGSVARISTGLSEGRKSETKGKPFVARESKLYAPLKDWLDEEWGADVAGGDFFEVCVTATPRGRNRGSGKWTRPDLTLVQVNNFEYLAMPTLEVTTFEVKKFTDAEDIRSIYEAAAHSRWAHYSYLVAEVPNGDHEFIERHMSELDVSI